MVSEWMHFGTNMPVNLSIKNAPDDLVKLVKERAQRNHRSLRGELLSIIEAAVRPTRSSRLTIDDIITENRRRGLRTASDSVDIVRRMRDERYGG